MGTCTDFSITLVSPAGQMPTRGTFSYLVSMLLRWMGWRGIVSCVRVSISCIHIRCSLDVVSIHSLVYSKPWSVKRWFDVPGFLFSSRSAVSAAFKETADPISNSSNEQPRTMSADAQARLNVALKDIILFYEAAKVAPESILLMENFVEKHLPIDFLTLAEGFGKCMAFIDHDELVSLLYKAFILLIDGYIIERKQINKKLKILKEDKKADPNKINNMENAIVDIDGRKAIAMSTMNRLKAMNLVPAALFRDPNFDAFAHYKVALAKHQSEVAAAAPPKKGKQ